MPDNSDNLLNSSLTEKTQWNLLNVLFAAFLFLAIAYPMPTQSKLGLISPLTVGVLGLFLLLYFLRFQVILYWNTYVFKMFIAFLFLLISDLLSGLFFNPIQQLQYLAARAAMVIIFFAGLSFFPSLANLTKIIKVYIWSIIILSLLTIAKGLSLIKFGTTTSRPRIYFGVTMPFKKAIGFDMSDGEFGLMVAPAFLFLLMQFFPKSGLKPLKGRTFLTVITGLALFISQSRSTWLGLVLAVLVMIIMQAKGKYRKILVISAVILGIIFLMTNAYSFIFKGFTGGGVYKRGVTGRIYALQAGFDYFKRSPLIGVGHGNATYKIPDLNRTLVIHNQIIDQLASAGILGVVPLLALYIIFFRTALRVYRDAKDSKLQAFTIWITASMVHVLTELMLYRGFYSEHLPWYFALLGILYSIQYGYKEVVSKNIDESSLLSAPNER